jgi:hypothetical protein
MRVCEGEGGVPPLAAEEEGEERAVSFAGLGSSGDGG